MELVQIGVIHSNYNKRLDAPRQGRLSDETQVIEIFVEYMEGMKGIENVSHLIVLYWFDRANRKNPLFIKPREGNEKKGVFATRSPNRPNPIAFSIAEVIKIEGNKITVKGLEALDQTPLLDIKPYSVEIDCVDSARFSGDKF
ncbi:tRNA (N6-threonylcarbamoyladenosine(37)-N6)-methyltransferase TrmO [Tepidibacillus sp. LV47]|uniref:tRNA (N6-threonylcarbamoyladenosine(37)-N6)-methyltransferase TrmO n=1 Tax=Tepidibacillus sp. LV47 TaxID=3398228 RepID=UPI003AB0A865